MNDPGDVTEALMKVRVRMHLAQHLGARANQALAPYGAARNHPWRAVAGACALADVASTRWLGRQSEFRLAPRLAFEAADVALWCAAAADDAQASAVAFVPGVAMACEAGIRMGPAGAVVPLVSAIAAGVVRKARGHRLRLHQALWQGMAVLGALVLTWFGRRQRVAALSQHDAELAARAHRAELEAQNEAAMGADPIVDLAQRATVLVGDDAHHPGANPLGAWKATLAEVTRQHAAYLLDVCAAWQASHNLHPDLASAVRLRVEPTDGTVIMTLEQADHLRAALSELRLAGAVNVRVATPPEQRRIGRSVDVRVGEYHIELPAEPTAGSWSFDPIPTGLLMGTIWMLPPLGRSREHLSLRAAALPLAASAGTTVWAYLRAERDGHVPRRSATLASFAVSLAYTGVATTKRFRSGTNDGVPRPFALALLGYRLTTELSRPELEGNERMLAHAGAGLITACAWFLSPRPRQLREFLAELVWPVVAGEAALLPRAIEDDASRLDTEMQARSDEVIRAAGQRGRQRVSDYVAAVTAGVSEQLANRWDELADDLRQEARRRLEEVRRRSKEITTDYAA